MKRSMGEVEARGKELDEAEAIKDREIGALKEKIRERDYIIESLSKQLLELRVCANSSLAIRRLG